MGVFLGALLSPQLGAQANAPEPPKMKIGDVAPDFTLKYFDGSGLKDVSLSQYRGKKNVVLAFYIFAFTGG
jgi:peroxiredoxin